MDASRHFLPPKSEHPNLVLCGVGNLADLEAVCLIMAAAGIRFRPFADDDLGDMMTAVATEPIGGAQRKLFRKYQCLK